MPRSSASCLASSSVTGIPAFAKVMAMPPPMVPAPITAHVAILRCGVLSLRPATLPAARSAKNACRSACDSALTMSSAKIFCSVAMPAVERLGQRRVHRFERAQWRGESTRDRGDTGPRELQEGLGLRMRDGAGRARGAAGCPACRSPRANSRAARRSVSPCRLDDDIEQRSCP